MAVSMIPSTKYVAFELLLHAAFVVDEIWVFAVEPARIIRHEHYSSMTIFQSFMVSHF